MGKHRHWLFAGITFIFVTSFQNCTVYKTSGRDYVTNGTAKQVHDANPLTKAGSTSDKLTSSCEPYIDDATASQIMDSFSTTKLVVDQTDEAVNCVISVNDPSSTPALDVAVCSISADNLELLQNPPDELTVLDPYGPLSNGSLGFSRTLASGKTQFVFVGSSDSALEAVACEFNFDNQNDYLTHSDEVQDRAARLVHQIAPHLR